MRFLTARLSSESAPVSIRLLDYKGIVFEDVAARGRLEGNTLFVESAAFTFAGGSGRGALVVDFPGWARSQAAFFGQVQGFDAGEVARIATGETSQMTGRADARVEIMSQEGRLNRFRADVSIETGSVGTPLSQFLSTVLPALSGIPATETGTAWPIRDARFSLELSPFYYDTNTARLKFGRELEDNSEFVGRLQFTTTCPQPSTRRFPFPGLAPLRTLASPINLLFENIQMRLFNERMRRILEAQKRAE